MVFLPGVGAEPIMGYRLISIFCLRLLVSMEIRLWMWAAFLMHLSTMLLYKSYSKWRRKVWCGEGSACGVYTIPSPPEIRMGIKACTKIKSRMWLVWALRCEWIVASRNYSKKGGVGDIWVSCRRKLKNLCWFRFFYSAVSKQIEFHVFVVLAMESSTTIHCTASGKSIRCDIDVFWGIYGVQEFLFAGPA